MNCELASELVLTDYSDGQMSPGRVQTLENHLMHCSSCRMLAEKVRAETVVPFKNDKAVGVDEFVWRRVKGKIQQEQAAVNFIYFFRPVLAMASLFIMLGIAFVIRHNFSPQGSYLTYMIGAENQGGNDVVSKGIEKYFL